MAQRLSRPSLTLVTSCLQQLTDNSLAPFSHLWNIFFFLLIWLNLKCGKKKFYNTCEPMSTLFISRQLLEAASKVLVFEKTPLWTTSCAFNPHDGAPANRPFIAMLGSWTVSLTKVDKGSRSQTALNLFVSFSSQKKPNLSYHLGAWDLK